MTKLLALAALALVAAPFAFAGHHGSSHTPEPLNPETQKPGLAVGAEAPNGTLLNVDREEVQLSEILEGGPVVLTFYRGGWCPYCNVALSGWAGRISELESAGARFIAISPERPEDAAKTFDKSGGGYEIYVDSTGEIARRFLVAFELSAETQKLYKGYGIDLEKANEDGRWELPAPATFVIDGDGVVRWKHATWDYRADDRADVDEVLAQVNNLN